MVINPYAIEKFTSAVHSMAVSPKSIQDRVADAYVFNLSHVKTSDLPESMCYRFEQLKEKLTSGKPVGNEGTVQAKTNTMSDTEAIETAQEIMYLYDEITHLA